ncbi:hypothetical protein [Gimesia aquarii]|uniref:Uncharacterized protein n=1 Tax=Gimesia aquarii TaxID=2527964 RepID=A0A517VSI1_9PLAN|nr:hypothetical protein [Gimesia aquarii]QDT95930.1 hypothetical protein V144x_13790 [Gimesia aquarii]
MSASQKHAWFNLMVILVSLIAVICLYPFLGWKANGALGLCGLLGFGPFFYRKRENEVVMDERDLLIEKRSTLLGYSVFWVVYVLVASLLLPMVYGKQGSIPVMVVQWSVFYALVLFLGLKSLATLVQHGRG